MNIYLIGIILLGISVLINVIVIGWLSSKNKEINGLNDYVDELGKKLNSVVTTENQKTKVRDKYNEIENDINNGNNIDNGVMPINATRKTGSYKNRSRKSNTPNS